MTLRNLPYIAALCLALIGVLTVVEGRGFTAHVAARLNTETLQ